MKSIASVLLSLPCAVAAAADLHVDAAGAPGTYPTVGSAMLDAVPGDRILVEPGVYPMYHHSRGVSVIGVGADPSAVQIARIDFHVTLPVVGFEALISNVTAGSADPADVIGISGNELGPGSLAIDGVVVNGGMFLRGGATGFHLYVSNTRVVPLANEGFGGAAATLGGANNVVELRNSRVVGWNADEDLAAPAGVGIRFIAGTEARIVNTDVFGGAGDAAPAPFAAGAAAIAHGFGSAAVRLRIDGGSSIQGGAGVGGAGGAGVAVPGVIALGSAVVAGGAGAPAGVAYAQAQPTALPFDPYLHLTPELTAAENQGRVYTGAVIDVTTGLPVASTAIVVGLELGQAAPTTGPAAKAGGFLSLDPAKWLFVAPGNQLGVIVPQLPAGTVPGLLPYFQALSFVPGQGLVASNTESVRIDLLDTAGP